MVFQMSRSYDEKNKMIVLKPVGDLDINSSEDFKKLSLKEYTKTNSDILIDGSKLDYLDSTGLGVLIYLYKETKENGHKIYLENIKKNIKKLFTITKLEDLFIFRGDNNE